MSRKISRGRLTVSTADSGDTDVRGGQGLWTEHRAGTMVAAGMERGVGFRIYFRTQQTDVPVGRERGQ